jgi:hypothetical protein
MENHRYIEGMKMQMQLIQFGLILTLIRMSHHTKNDEQLRLKALLENKWIAQLSIVIDDFVKSQNGEPSIH